MFAAHTTPEGRLPLLLTLFWIAGMPVFMLFSGRLIEGVPLLRAERVAFALALIPFVALLIRRPRSLQAPGRVELAMAVYFGVILLSWATTLPNKSVDMIKQDADFLLTCFVMPFTAFLIARNTAWTRRRFHTCLWILVGGVGGYLLLFGAAQYIYDWNFLVPDVWKNIHPERAKGPWDNSVPFGVVVCMLVPLTLFLYLRAARGGERLLCIAIAVGLLESIVACKTRAVWMALPVALLLPAWRYPRVRLLSALLAAQLAVQVLVAPALGLDFWGLRPRLVQKDQVYDRIAVSATASNMIEHQPLFGFGFGTLTFNEGKGDYYLSWAGIETHWAVFPNNPHNDFLNVLVMMGLFGLLPFVALLGSDWSLLQQRGARARSVRPDEPELATFVQGAFLVLLIAGFMHSVMHMSFAQVLFYFLLGMVACEGPIAAPATVESAHEAAPPQTWPEGAAAALSNPPGGRP